MSGYVCGRCGHGWTWHSDYDDSLERFVDHACDYWEPCDCKGYVDPPEWREFLDKWPERAGGGGGR